MSPGKNRRRFLCLVGGAVSVATAGCLGAGSREPKGEQTSQTTISESELDDETAKTRALNAEEDYLREQLSNATCLHDWGTTGPIIDPVAKVNKRTEEGVIVDTSHPWWYVLWDEEGSNETQETQTATYTDTSSRAEYLVTPEDTDRLSGDYVSPC